MKPKSREIQSAYNLLTVLKFCDVAVLCAKKPLDRNEISRDSGLRWVSEGNPVLHHISALKLNSCDILFAYNSFLGRLIVLKCCTEPLSDTELVNGLAAEMLIDKRVCVTFCV